MGIDKDKSLSAATELTRRAEEKLKTKTSEAGFTRTDAEMQRIIHELEVHQIELEMQNAELKQAREEVETALEKYTDLYDFSPVGYFTIARNGTISAVNLSGASLLGVERSHLVGRRFGPFVKGDYLLVFTAFLDTVFTSHSKEVCEVALLNSKNLPLIVQIEAIATASAQECRFVLIDHTARKQAEEALLKAGALQSAIFNSANFSSIATDAKGVIQIFNVGAERMLGYTADEVMDKITPADISDPQEVISRAKKLSLELGTTITPGFEALVFKA